MIIGRVSFERSQALQVVISDPLIG